MVGKVVKLDFNIDNGARGHFSRMVVYVNLDKLLMIWTHKRNMFKYEILSKSRWWCASSDEESLATDAVMVDSDRVEEIDAYKLWMIVERKPVTALTQPVCQIRVQASQMDHISLS
ncbi:hypothetical protein Golob_024909 [Gossypium lobatum]|uniref:Uncharacterized protein n=1 Tax=Gossypium lobatum TaxID=34289 RepID=A0A7J8NM22_9ROSI|nr:hypothetical protein [Gossypium lobatum]